MDPITTAILAGIAAGAVSGATKVGEKVVVGSYNKLKELIKEKLGSESAVIKAVKGLEANPKSTARKEVVKEEVAAAKADQDQELIQAAQALIKRIKVLPGGTQIIQTAIGNGNTQIAGDGNRVNINKPKAKR